MTFASSSGLPTATPDVALATYPVVRNPPELLSSGVESQSGGSPVLALVPASTYTSKLTTSRNKKYSASGDRTKDIAPEYPHKLPLEILGHIFLHVALAEGAGERESLAERLKIRYQLQYRGTLQKTSLEWILAITHVCSLWRAVALRNPTIWAEYIPLGLNKPWTQELILRTKNVPLAVEAHLGPDLAQIESQTEEVLEQLHRTWELVPVDGMGTMAPQGTFYPETMIENDMSKFKKALARMQSAPVLERCQIHAPGREWRPRYQHVPEEFLRDAPRLHYLSLHGWRVDVNCHLLSNRLTTLEIVNSWVTSMVSVLKKTENLERLVLDQVWRSYSGDQPTHGSDREVHLSRLRHLKIHTDVFLSIQILKGLVFPKITMFDLRLEWFPTQNWLSDAKPILAELGDVILKHMDQISFLYVMDTEEGDFHIQAWNDPRVTELQLVFAPPQN